MRPNKQQLQEIEEEVQCVLQDALEMDEPYTTDEIEELREEITEKIVVYDPIFEEYESYIVSIGKSASEMVNGLESKDIYLDMPKELFFEN